jgi:PilZ domain-containing protein
MAAKNPSISARCSGVRPRPDNADGFILQPTHPGPFDPSNTMQTPSQVSARRRFARTPVKTNAFVHCGRRFQRAQIVDHSLGGLRLEGTFGLIKHDPIQVELITGTRVLGKVASSLGAHTGMIFHEPLPPSHPAPEEP